MSLSKVRDFVGGLLSEGMHRKRAESIALAVFGALRADRLSTAAIGSAQAAARGTSAKHAIKQVDRLVGNEKFDVVDVFRVYVPWIVGERPEMVVSLDWTEYASDGHSRIAINLVTKHGRATPLIWMTVETSDLESRRNGYEDELLVLLADVIPEGTAVTVLADRGFGDEKLYRFLDQLGFGYVIRFRGVINVEDQDGELRAGREWVYPNGRIRELVGAKVTDRGTRVGAVVTVKKRGMKDSWLLVTSLAGQKERVVQLYSRRFTCEENFRDEKDRRFGLGFKQTRVSTCERRDRLLAINALATVLNTLLGAAGEKLGLDRHLKSNTAARRIHSLFRQGRQFLQGCIASHASALRDTLWKMIADQPTTTEIMGLI